MKINNNKTIQGRSPFIDVNVVAAKQVLGAPNKADTPEIYQLRLDRSDLMTIDEVAQMLRCSIRHVNNLRRKGYLRFFRHGAKMVRIRRSSVERYIEEWSTQTTLAD